MTKHGSATVESQSLCDALLSELRGIEPTTKRKESRTVCSLSCGGSNFAYFYHSAKKNRIYLRANHNEDIAPRHATLGVSRRLKIETPWEKDFPFHCLVTDISEIPQLTAVLAELSIPLAARRKKARTTTPLTIPPLPQQVADGVTFVEGAVKQIQVNAYERDPKARKASLAHYGTACVICGFDFAEVFGPQFSGVIEVHHLKPLASIQKQYRVDPIRDLRPVCPNCHTAIHRREPPYGIDELIDLLRKQPRV